MEGALVSAATGALQPVLAKLSALLGDEEGKRLDQARGEIESLARELAAVQAFLLEMSDEEDPDARDEAWMKAARELSYDVEDDLDDFMLRVGDESAEPDGFMEKIKELLDRTKAVQDAKRKTIQVSERNARHNADEPISRASNATIDRRAISEDASKLVGIDGPKTELIQLLTEDAGCEPMQQQPKVISIVGCGGVGKTALADQVYLELKGQFECDAFLSVSRNPDTVKVLRAILSQVTMKRYINTEAGDEQEFITRISEFLANKRYFIVVDDIWNVELWDVIKCAFPINCCGSKIITTTRINDVAQACCSSFSGHIYNIRPLSMVHSSQLFYRRLFNSEEEYPSHLKEISSQILEKCGGLPLAIIVISGLLANKASTKDQWNQVKNSVGCALDRNSSAEEIEKILSIGYFDLPCHLKTCLLYLSMFPKDCTIDKENLIRRWIGERFIKKQDGYTMQESGEMCFNELLNRSLIQPVETDGMFGEVKSCRVHGTIFYFIVSKAIEENFVTLIYVPGVKPDPRCKVRRVSLQADGEIATGLVLSGALSLTVFGSNVKIPYLLELRFLRALAFEECGQLQDHHLADVGKLFHLKHLRLNHADAVTKLPEQIAELPHLETLDIHRYNTVMVIPASIDRLERLECLVTLVADGYSTLPDGVGGLQALRVLEGINVNTQSTYFLQQLGELTNLRKLGITFLNYDAGDNWEENTREIISSICKLGRANLHSLHMFINEGSDEILKDRWCSPAPVSVQELVIEGDGLSDVPRWMGSLVNLTKLHLPMWNLSQQDVEILGGLPSLLYLRVQCYWDESDEPELKASLERAIELHPNHPTMVWVAMD